MPDLNALASLFSAGKSAVKNKLAGLIKPSEVMSPAERAAYAQATGEDIQGNAIPQQESEPMRAGYSYQPPQQTIDPEEVARYLAMRKAQHEALMRQRGM